VGEIDYRTKREIIDELLYKDRNLFSEHDLEFDIFKYTALFAVLTFTFQIIISMIKNFYGLSYLTYSQFLIFIFSLLFITTLVELLVSLIYIIKRKSFHDKKSVYLRSYDCRTCNFTSCSEFYSNLHISSHPDHTLRYNQVLLEFKRFNRPWFLRLLVVNRQKKLKELCDPDFTILSESNRRIKDEITETHEWNKAHLIMKIILIFIVIFSIFSLYYLNVMYRSPLIMFASIITFSFSFVVDFYIFLTLIDVDYVYICKIYQIDRKEKGNPNVRLKFIKVSSLYWKYVKNKPEKEPIETLDGPLHIVDKIVLNKFGEPIEVIPE